MTPVKESTPGAPPTAPARDDRGRWRAPIVLALAGLLTAVVAAILTGAADPFFISDAGPIVRWGLPLVTVVAHLSSAITLGLLVFAAFVMPETTKTHRREGATRIAAVSAFVWGLSSAIAAYLTFADLAGLTLGDPALLGQFSSYVFALEATRIIVIAAGVALVVSVVAAFTRSRPVMAWASVATLVAILIGALTSHSGGSASHEDSVNSMAVHLLGVAVWVGGLVALLVMRSQLGRDLGVSVRRYSTMAVWAYGAVVLSGIQQAIIRVGSLTGFTTSYGLMVLAKIAILIVLGVLGWQQRRAIAERLTHDPGDGRAVARLGLVELALMGAAIGLGAVLSRSAPPVPDSLPNPSMVLALTGFPDPGPMTDGAWLTAWRINWLFLSIAVLAVALYLAGVVKLRRRGVHWPLWQTILWVIGWSVFVYFTSGAPEIWGRVLFSVHMIMHMGVAMLLPVLLVPAAPITLALRALPIRPDKTWGPREVLLQLVHARAMKWLANPAVAALFFFFSMAVFYYSPAFELSLTTHTGHLLMMGHFLLTGYLFVWVLIGTDPGPPKWNPLMLLVILFATISFHAFFGVILTDSTDLLAPGFFERINLPWGPDPLADQHKAGMIAWGVGEVPTLILSVLVAWRWIISDRAETKRKDRAADRDGDADLNAYNDYLAGLRQKGEQR